MSSNPVTIARPYAKAAFEYALDTKKLPEWSKLLQFASTLVSEPTLASALLNPKVSTDDIAKLLLDLCADMLNTESSNFIQLLASRKRLGLLPQMAKLYASYQADYEKIVDVDVVSAFPLEAETQNKLSKALQNRLQRQVSLNCVIDKDIMGGLIIRAGDLTIDGSIRGRLNKLAASMAG